MSHISWETQVRALRDEILARFHASHVIQKSVFGLMPEPQKRGHAFGVSTFLNCFALLFLIVLSMAHGPVLKPYPPESIVLNFDQPKHIHLVAPKSVAIPRHNRVGTFAMAKSTITANNRPARMVKVGAFGNPMGARPNTTLRVSRMQAPLLGTFGGIQSAAGAGSGRAGARGGVRLVGFGPGNGNSSGTEPVTVTAGAKPIYTAEARAAHVEGDVVMRVCFTAGGHVEILSVLHSLGHGLDQSAENAVLQYRFNPATRDGRPIDQTTTVHVRFQLAT